MKRSELKRGKPPVRRTELKKVNRKRRARLYERNFGDYAADVRADRCLGCGANPPSDPAHAIGRKGGGCGGDKRVLVPLCKDRFLRRGCHSLFDTDIEAFTKRTGLTREDVIAMAAERWGHHQQVEARLSYDPEYEPLTPAGRQMGEQGG